MLRRHNLSAVSRLVNERCEWRRDHPFGFVAKPTKYPDGSDNYLEWECAVPGMENTPWANGFFKLKIYFTVNYPFKPPSCKFDPPLFHPNVTPNGLIHLPLLDKHWQPSNTVKQILVAIQNLLARPNVNDPADPIAHKIFCEDPEEYKRLILSQAKAYRRKWE